GGVLRRPARLVVVDDNGVGLLIDADQIGRAIDAILVPVGSIDLVVAVDVSTELPGGAGSERDPEGHLMRAVRRQLVGVDSLAVRAVLLGNAFQRGLSPMLGHVSQEGVDRAPALGRLRWLRLLGVRKRPCSRASRHDRESGHRDRPHRAPPRSSLWRRAYSSRSAARMGGSVAGKRSAIALPTATSSSRDWAPSTSDRQ